MFWRCFTYDFKGPCHVYLKETEEQREEYKERIEKLNDKEIIKECCIKFET
jgi:hypothetical protein